MAGKAHQRWWAFRLRKEVLMPRNIVDSINYGGIVTVRDQLLHLQSTGKKVMRLESGDPSFDVPVHIRQAIEKALRDGHTHYTAGTGIPQLRQAAFDKLRRENQIPVVDPDHVLVTNGAMHGLYITFRALLNPGDEVIVPDPTWTETVDNITLAGGIARACRLCKDHKFIYEADAIGNSISKKTRAIVINTPHNPTGVVLEKKTLESILQLAREHDLFIVSDEAYEHIVYDGSRHVSIASLPDSGDRVISLYSLSKSYAMSGLRLGYLTANNKLLIERMTKLLRCTVNGLNSATQHGGVAALNGEQKETEKMRSEYQQRRDLLVAALRRSRYFDPFKPSGAFYVWAEINKGWSGHNGIKDGWAMTNFLIENSGIGSSPGEVFGNNGEGFIRFSFSCPTDQIIAAAERLQNMS